MSYSTQNQSSVNVAALLKKTEHYDKDERYMAISDLRDFLKRQEVAHDTNTERQICSAVLRLLHDKSNDVQAMAVKTLSDLLTTVQQEQVLEIADSLADQVLDTSKSELRDVYSIGLRTLVKTIPFKMGDKVSQRLVGRLLDGIRSSEEEIVLACLDTWTEVLTRFGSSAVHVSRQHQPLLIQCLSLLNSPTPILRKRSGNCIGVLSTVLNDSLLDQMVQSLLEPIENPKSKDQDTGAWIRTLCTVSGAVGHRLGQQQIDRILTLFLQFTKPAEAVTGDDDDQDDDEHMSDANDEHALSVMNELRESCFTGFESFILLCPREVEPHMDKIIQSALAYMSYDPNYSYGITDDEEGEDQGDDDYDLEDEDEYEEEEDDDDEDDDDESWKVRRSAIRALKGVATATRQDPARLWTKTYSIRNTQSSIVASAILERFKEREENCRVELIDCFTNMVKSLVAANDKSVISIGSKDDMSDVASVDFESSYAAALVKACGKILDIKKGNERSKSSALSLLATLCSVPGGIGGSEAITATFDRLQDVMAASSGKDQALHRETTSKALRLDALTTVHAVLASPYHQASAMQKDVREKLLPQLCQSVQEQWYKVIAEALRSLAKIPKVFGQGTGYEPEGSKAVATMVYDAIEPLLATHDVDQEIKDCALEACAALLTAMHDSLTTDQTNRMLKLLLDRLQNETTRIAAIKTLGVIAGDSTAIDLSPILADAVQSMGSFLKLQSRSLKQASLEALDVVVTNHGKTGNLEGGELYSAVLLDLAPLLVASDLHLTHLSLRVCISILKACPAVGPSFKSSAVQQAVSLSTAPALQDPALGSLLAFFGQSVESGAVGCQDLYADLRKQLKPEAAKSSVYNLAECLAATTVAGGTDAIQSVLDEALKVCEKNDDVREIQVSVLIAGDVCRRVDCMSLDGNEANRLRAAFVKLLDYSTDEVTSAAAYALGNASVGTPSVFLEEIVQKVNEDHSKHKYLVLSALRDFIKCSQKSGQPGTSATSLSTMLPALEKSCGDAEEGVRTMVAECLGSLCCLHPSEMLPKLESIFTAHDTINAPGGKISAEDDESKLNAHVCWTVMTAVKLAIPGKVDKSVLSTVMPTFVGALQQEEVSLRTAALLMVYSAAHHMPEMLTGLLEESVLPELYKIIQVKMERKVDLGPFTHTVDDALPLRKSALSIFATCLENMPGSMDMSQFMPVLAKSLGDAEDIQLHAHQIVIAMSSRQPIHLVGSIDSFVEPLEKTMNKKPGQKTGTELERLNDWIKSALRVLLVLSKLDGAMNAGKFGPFVERVKANSKFSDKLRAIQEER